MVICNSQNISLSDQFTVILISYSKIKLFFIRSYSCYPFQSFYPPRRIKRISTPIKASLQRSNIIINADRKKIQFYFNWDTTINTIAIKANKSPIIFSLFIFSLKTKIPTRLPITITPIFIPANTVDGLSANA
jgi:hypothetical protein